jgi:uncharacterized protein (DUF1015 family)
VVGNSSDFVYPPFDIISPDEAEALRRRNPYNEVNLELTGPDSTRQPGRAVYESTAKLFDGWVRSGVLSAVSRQCPIRPGDRFVSLVEQTLDVSLDPFAWHRQPPVLGAV